MDIDTIEQSKRFSHIGMHSNTNHTYALQYKEAFNTLYESSKPVDTIALPMMFLMRHYLELILKENIIYFSKFSESKVMLTKIKSEHKLKPLANAFIVHWNLVVKKYMLKTDGREYLKDFNAFIDLIEQFDKNSMSFRYSHDKNNVKHFGWDDTLDVLDTLDIYTIKQSLDKILPFVQYAIDVFDEQIEEDIK